MNNHFIVEFGVSHRGEIERAKKALREIAHARVVGNKLGIEVLAKTQLYDPYTLFPSGETARYFPEGQAALSKAQYKHLVRYGASLGVPVFASAFDAGSVKTVLDASQANPLKPPMIKLGSRAHRNWDLYREMQDWADENTLRKSIEVIISTGYFKDGGAPANLALSESRLASIASHLPRPSRAHFLYCIPEYPHVFSEKELRQIHNLIKKWPYSGLSDHSKYDDNKAFKVAIDAGQTWYERHYTDNRGLTEIDADCSIELNELLALINIWGAKSKGEQDI